MPSPMPFFAAGWDTTREILKWMRKIPLLKELPAALAEYFMNEEDMADARRREVDPLEYLRCKTGDRVRCMHK